MSKGKFSEPRPYRDEEREIEQAFREMTGQALPSEPAPQPENEAYQPLSESFPELNLEDPLAQPEPVSPEDLYLDEEEEAEPDFVDKAQAFFQKVRTFCGQNPRVLLLGLCSLALVVIIGFMAAIFMSTSDPYDGKILSNVYVAGVNVGGMTKNEAISAVKQATAQTYAKEDMVVDLAGTTLRLSPSDTKVSLDVKAAVAAAYDYGRTGTKAEQHAAQENALATNHFIGLLPYLQLDQAYIRQVLESYSQDTGSTLTQSAYGLEGTMPELSADKFDENAKPQTLVITMGTPGVGYNAKDLFNRILDAYSLNQFLVTVEAIEPDAEPDPIDLEKIWEEICIEPINATVDMQTFEPIPGSYGYVFDLEAAQELIDHAAFGEEIRIPMEYVEPEILDKDVFFRDVLGSCETKLNSNANRNANLKLVCEALNGLVLNPGEEFSYNQALGQRTAEKGYKPAPSYAGLETVDTVGGGICQGSSTLYYCVLLADLRVTARQNHSFVPSYIDYGMDATVSWGGPDFKFVNSSNFPIKIEAEVSDGYVRMKLLGTDEKDYYIKMEYSITGTNSPETEYEEYPADNREGYKDGDVLKNGVTGYYVKSYKLKYDKETDKLLSKDFEANSSYVKVNKVVVSIKAPETEPPTEPPTEAPTQPPAPTNPPETTPPETVPPTEPPLETPPATEPSEEAPPEEDAEA